MIIIFKLKPLEIYYINKYATFILSEILVDANSKCSLNEKWENDPNNDIENSNTENMSKCVLTLGTQDHFLYLLSSELGKRGNQTKLKWVELASSSINKKQFPETK